MTATSNTVGAEGIARILESVATTANTSAAKKHRIANYYIVDSTNLNTVIHDFGKDAVIQAADFNNIRGTTDGL